MLAVSRANRTACSRAGCARQDRGQPGVGAKRPVPKVADSTACEALRTFPAKRASFCHRPATLSQTPATSTGHHMAGAVLGPGDILRYLSGRRILLFDDSSHGRGPVIYGVHTMRATIWLRRCRHLPTPARKNVRS